LGVQPFLAGRIGLTLALLGLPGDEIPSQDPTPV